VKGTRSVILIETVLLIVAIVCGSSVYSRGNAKLRANERKLAELREQYATLLDQYEEMNMAYTELKDKAGSIMFDNSGETADIGDIQRELEYERKRYKELAKAFEEVSARADRYEEELEQRDEYMAEFEARRAADFGPGFGGPRPEGRRMGDRWLHELQMRIETSEDPAEKERLTEMVNSVESMREVGERIRNAETEEERQQAIEEMRELRREFREMGGGRFFGGGRGGMMGGGMRPPM